MQNNYNLLKDDDFLGLSGKFLIASPYQSFNDMFRKSIIYIVSSTKDGVIGLIINQKIDNVPFLQLAKNIFDKQSNITMPLPVLIGGPNELSKGFVLHSCEYQKNILFQYEDKLSISSNLEIFEDIQNGDGPLNMICVMGYTGWHKGQLEEEIMQNYWLISDFHQDMIFSKNMNNKWEESLKRMGIKESMFSPSSGKS